MGTDIKRCHVSANPAGIDPVVETAAYAFLPGFLPKPDDTPPATLGVLHGGGDGGIYFKVHCWVWENMQFLDKAATAEPALGCPENDPTHFIRQERSLIGSVGVAAGAA